VTDSLTVAQLMSRLSNCNPDALVRTESGEGLTDVLTSDTQPLWHHEPTVHLLFYGADTGPITDTLTEQVECDLRFTQELQATPVASSNQKEQ
jgi:hypothetical protein